VAVNALLYRSAERRVSTGSVAESEPFLGEQDHVGCMRVLFGIRDAVGGELIGADDAGYAVQSLDSLAHLPDDLGLARFVGDIHH